MALLVEADAAVLAPGVAGLVLVRRDARLSNYLLATDCRRGHRRQRRGGFVELALRHLHQLLYACLFLAMSARHSG